MYFNIFYTKHQTSYKTYYFVGYKTFDSTPVPYFKVETLNFLNNIFNKTNVVMVYIWDVYVSSSAIVWPLFLIPKGLWSLTLTLQSMLGCQIRQPMDKIVLAIILHNLVLLDYDYTICNSREICEKIDKLGVKTLFKQSVWPTYFKTILIFHEKDHAKTMSCLYFYLLQLWTYLEKKHN